MAIFLKTERAVDSVLLGYRSIFMALAVFSGVINLLMLIPSLYMMQVFDRVLTSRNETTLLMLSLLALGLFLFSSLLERLRGQIMLRLSASLDQKLGARVLNAAFQHHLTQPTANPAQFLSDLTSVRQFLTGSGLNALLDAPWLPIYLAITFLFHPWLGYFTLTGLLLLIVLTLWNEWATRQSLADANQRSVEAANYINASLQNAEVIQGMGMWPQIEQRWRQQQNAIVYAQIDASEQSTKISALSRFIRTSWQSLALGLGALLVLEQQISAGSMIAVSLLLGRAMAPLEQLVASWKQLGNAKISYRRLSQLLDGGKPLPSRLQLPAPTGQLHVEQLIVQPPGRAEPVINGVNFSLDKGDILAIIGPSASGKSSLVRAILGIWPVKQGAIRLDSATIDQWSRESLGPYIGYLPQNIELLQGTVAENIARFGPLESQKIIDAAQMAGIHEMILHFPQGYNTLLGTGSFELSGGQKQRLGLARALYAKPVLVVLDEPNSNLDEAGDQALSKALSAIKAEGSTVILITHRPSSLSVVDKLLYLKDGVQQLFGPRDVILKALLPITKTPSPTTTDPH